METRTDNNWRSLAAKVGRIVLTFLLVFWCSFKIEIMTFEQAYAANSKSSSSSSADDEAKKKAEEEAARKKAEEEEAARKKAEEEEAARKAAEEAERQKQEQEQQQGGSSGSSSGGSASSGGSESSGSSSSASSGASEDPSGSSESPDAEKEKADKEAADAVVKLIDAIGEVTEDSESAIKTARSAYDKLTDDQKKLISADELKKLTDAEKAFAELDEKEEKPLFDSTKHEDGSLTALEVWTIDADDSKKAGEKVRDNEQTAKNTSQALLSLDATLEKPDTPQKSNKVSVFAYPTWNDAKEVDRSAESWRPEVGKADFVDWTVEGDDCVKVEKDGGLLTLTGQKPGKATVTLKLASSKSKLASSEAKSPLVVTFEVEVKVPYVTIELLKSDGEQFDIGEALDLAEDERGKDNPYKFKARVWAHDLKSGDQIKSFECTDEAGLAKLSGDLYEDLKWEVIDENDAAVSKDLATIDEKTGVFVLTKVEGTMIVRCSSEAGYNDTVASAQVSVGEKNRQGENHPQDSLTVTVKQPLIDPETGEVIQNGDANPTQTESSDAAAKSGSSASASAASASASAASAEAETPAGDEDLPETKNIKKTYSVSDLEALGFATQTYTMQGADGPMVIKGRGASLAMILDDVGVTMEDQPNIESIEFVDYRDVHTTVDWSSLTASSGASKSVAMLAAMSYVMPEGATEEDAAEKTDDDLLENTRFRLLVGTTSTGVFDPAALCSINEVIVNLKGVETVKKPDPQGLEVWIDYAPVPKGKAAVLSAVPSREIGSSYFGFQWQESNDGKSWSDVSGGAVQTLRVMTDEAHIGRWYRVVLDTDKVDPNVPDQTISVTSEAVQLKDASANDFTVQLVYDPPLAGDAAIFQASVQGKGIDAGKCEYIWEESEDGGITWVQIPKAKGASFSVPTEPISADASSDASSDDTPIIYIRVRAIAPDGRKATSNMQPLTVRVGNNGGGSTDSGKVAEDIENGLKGNEGEEEDGKDKKDKKDKSKESEKSKQSEKSEESKKSEDKKPEPQPTPSPTPMPTPTPEANTTNVEDSETESTPEPAQNEQASTEQPTSTKQKQVTEITDLVVDPNVSAEILKQNDSAEKLDEKTQPGLRWTQLSTVNPDGDDVSTIFADNPFAPFAMPTGLGLIAAGGVEKLLAFRRQMR